MIEAVFMIIKNLSIFCILGTGLWWKESIESLNNIFADSACIQLVLEWSYHRILSLPTFMEGNAGIYLLLQIISYCIRVGIVYIGWIEEYWNTNYAFSTILEIERSLLVAKDGIKRRIYNFPYHIDHHILKHRVINPRANENIIELRLFCYFP